jgi:hypothetical protein
VPFVKGLKHTRYYVVHIADKEIDNAVR